MLEHHPISVRVFKRLPVLIPVWVERLHRSVAQLLQPRHGALPFVGVRVARIGRPQPLAQAGPADRHPPFATRTGPVRPAVSECDPRQPNDIGFLRREREELLAIASDEDRGVGALDREWVNLMPGHSIVLAGECDLLTLEQTLDDGDRLREALDSGAAGIETKPRLVAAAALISAGMGAKILAMWSGTVKTEYPNSSAFCALSVHSDRDPALQAFTPKRNGFITMVGSRAWRLGEGDALDHPALRRARAPAAAVARRRPTPKMLMAGRDPAMSVRRNAGETPAFQAISLRRAGSGRHASTTPQLPWPPPCPRRSAGSACPTAARHCRRRSRGNRFP
jgi:hypothetical protein